MDWGEGVLPTAVCAEDLCCWPHSAGVLVKWFAFLGTLHWPAAGADLGVGGVSCVDGLDSWSLHPFISP